MGTSVLYFKQLYPQAYIYAFEPDMAIFSILQSNIALNNLSKVEAINKAVFIDNQERYFMSSNAQSGSIVNNESSVKVSCIRLKDFMSSFDYIDFLKLDIEGAEVEVLNDIKELLFKVNHVFVEYHSYLNQPQSLSTLLSVFESNGFRYVIGGDQKKHPFTHEATDEKMDFTVDIFATKI
jgi:FkbM family methyltransferase